MSHKLMDQVSDFSCLNQSGLFLETKGWGRCCTVSEASAWDVCIPYCTSFEFRLAQRKTLLLAIKKEAADDLSACVPVCHVQNEDVVPRFWEVNQWVELYISLSSKLKIQISPNPKKIQVHTKLNRILLISRKRRGKGLSQGSKPRD